MPATAGRVRMPANNRVHSSAALQTHGIWQSAIGYDPYAPDKVQRQDDRGAPDPTAGGGAIATDEQNAYDSFQGETSCCPDYSSIAVCNEVVVQNVEQRIS